MSALGCQNMRCAALRSRARAVDRRALNNDHARLTRTMGVVGMRLLHNDDKLSIAGAIAARRTSTTFSFCTDEPYDSKSTMVPLHRQNLTRYKLFNND